MQSRQQVILRRRGAITRSRIPGPPGFSPTNITAGSAADEVRLEHAPMSPTEVADVQRDPAVICVAPAMPLKLVKPFAAEGVQVSSTGNTWDIEAVRAHTTNLDGSGIVVAVVDTGINPSHGPGVAVTSAWVGGAQALQTTSGMSMATPPVAGCAALWAQQLAQAGALTTENLTAKALACAAPIAGQAFDDVGNALVLAPQQ